MGVVIGVGVVNKLVTPRMLPKNDRFPFDGPPLRGEGWCHMPPAPPLMFRRSASINYIFYRSVGVWEPISTSLKSLDRAKCDVFGNNAQHYLTTEQVLAGGTLGDFPDIKNKNENIAYSCSVVCPLFILLHRIYFKS